MPHGAVCGFRQPLKNTGTLQDLSGLQADISLVQHGLLTCEWSLQPEVGATDNKPIPSSWAQTASSLIKQAASLHFLRPRHSTP